MTGATDEDFELSVERHIAAPVMEVWRTMIERFDEWFCPRPWRADGRHVEWRPGGSSLVIMHGPNGEEMPNPGIVLAFEPGRRFVVTDAVAGDFRPATPFMIGVFEVQPAGTGTLYRASARHWTAEAMAQHRDMGFEAGWGAAADQLKTLAEGGEIA